MFFNDHHLINNIYESILDIYIGASRQKAFFVNYEYETKK